MPQRIQRKRTKGWKLPETALIVARPSRYGNPYVVGVVYGDEAPMTAQEAVEAYEHTLAEWKRLMPSDFEKWIAPLRGHDLCCWCKVGDFCHADTLIQYANEGVKNE